MCIGTHPLAQLGDEQSQHHGDRGPFALEEIRGGRTRLQTELKSTTRKDSGQYERGSWEAEKRPVTETIPGYDGSKELLSWKRESAILPNRQGQKLYLWKLTGENFCPLAHERDKRLAMGPGQEQQRKQEVRGRATRPHEAWGLGTSPGKLISSRIQHQTKPLDPQCWQASNCSIDTHGPPGETSLAECEFTDNYKAHKETSHQEKGPVGTSKGNICTSRPRKNHLKVPFAEIKGGMETYSKDGAGRKMNRPVGSPAATQTRIHSSQGCWHSVSVRWGQGEGRGRITILTI